MTAAFHLSRRPAALSVVAVLASVLVLPSVLSAQLDTCSESVSDHVNGEVWVNRTTSLGVLPAGWYSAAYSFVMHYDSVSTSYTFTELERNGTKIDLDNWDQFQEIKTLDAPALTSISRSVPFTVRTGDIIRFFRDFRWWDHGTTPTQTTNNFQSRDTLDYAVELVDQSTGTVVATLDQFGVLRRLTKGYPSFYGNEPIMRKPAYTVPAALNDTVVYVRVRLSVRGDGDYYPIRNDKITGDLSGKLVAPEWSAYRQYYNQGFLKLRLEDLESTGLSSFSVAAYPNPSTGSITLQAKSQAHASEDGVVAVYDATGKPVYVSTSVSIGADPTMISVELLEAGSYYAVIFVEEKIVATKEFHVIR